MSLQDSQEIEPMEINHDTRFTFRCHPGVSCFNECCAQTTIILSPYDVLRLKRHLQLSSKEFLSRYTEQHLDDFSGLPLVVLNMAGEKKICPFSTPVRLRRLCRPARHLPLLSGGRRQPVDRKWCGRLFRLYSRGALSRFSRRRGMDPGDVVPGSGPGNVCGHGSRMERPSCCRLGRVPASL